MSKYQYDDSLTNEEIEERMANLYKLLGNKKYKDIGVTKGQVEKKLLKFRNLLKKKSEYKNEEEYRLAVKEEKKKEREKREEREREKERLYKEMDDTYKMIQKQIDYVKNLPKELQDSLIWYISDDFFDFNKALRSGIITREDHLKNLNNINLVFENAPPLDNQIVVYRGVKGEEQVISDNSFMSTSLFIYTGRDFANVKEKCCLMKITVSAGVKILPLKFIPKGNNGEDEILLDRNQILVITHKSFDEEGLKTFHATSIPQTSMIVEKQTMEKIERKMDSEESLYNQITNKIFSEILRKEDHKDLKNEKYLNDIISSRYKEHLKVIDEKLPLKIPEFLLNSISARIIDCLNKN